MASMTGERVVFVHGSGRAGAQAWPQQGLWGGAVFLTRSGFGPGEPPAPTDFELDSQLVHDACGDGAAVVAASYGAIAAIQAASRPDSVVTSLVLCEPAAFSLARGRRAVEAHIAAVEPILSRAAELSGPDFLAGFLSALGIAAPPPETPAELERADRLRLQRAPWAAELDPAVFGRVPTLVITGRWNDEYEELAEELVTLGARHRWIEGFGHNPQDSSLFEGVVRGFWDRVPPTTPAT